MLEIDTPSHTACWCRGYGEKVCPPKPCKDGITSTPLDPSTNNTFDMVQQVLQELSAQFPEELLHVGQDEVRLLSLACYVPASSSACLHRCDGGSCMQCECSCIQYQHPHCR
jgi:N-acetyl-beta-hexosaminidase